MAKITVIIPIYNGEKTLEQCLDSIFRQTLDKTKIEIIAVNDGSIDNTKNILKKYQEKIIVVDQPNKGANQARNAGAKLATSPYIIFCDADVIMKETMLQKMYEVLEKNPQVSYVYSSFIFGKKLFRLWEFDAEKLKKMPYIHTTSLIRKNHFPGFDKNLKKFQDWDLWLTMLKRGYSGKFIPEVLFTVQSGGTMSSWLPKFMYKFYFLPSVKKYQQAEKIIKAKHNL